MASEPSEKKFCVYCGAAGDLTDDHVPPKNLFPKPRPSNLITVLACLKCNGSASKDDEYFRHCLCMSEKVGRDPEAAKNRPAIFRSLENPKAPGLRKAVAAGIRQVPMWTASGLYAGNTTAFDVDINRLHRVVERTVRGLFFHVTGERVPDEYTVIVHSDDSLAQCPPEYRKNVQETILPPLFQAEPVVLGENVFAYRLLFAEGHSIVSGWLMHFYAQVPFVAVITPTPPDAQ